MRAAKNVIKGGWRDTSVVENLTLVEELASVHYTHMMVNNCNSNSSLCKCIVYTWCMYIDKGKTVIFIKENYITEDIC